MKQKILLLTGIFLLAISYVQASNVRMVWHVNVENKTNNDIKVGGLTTFPDGRIRYNCWWTDPDTGNNQLWESQSLSAGFSRTWTTNEMSFDMYNCQPYNLWSTHYMEFKINDEAVSINSSYLQTGYPMPTFLSYAYVMFNGAQSGQDFDTTSNKTNDTSIYVTLQYYGPENIVTTDWHF